MGCPPIITCQTALIELLQRGKEALTVLVVAVFSGAFGKFVDENHGRYIGAVHDTSAPTVSPGMSECTTNRGANRLCQKSTVITSLGLTPWRYTRGSDPIPQPVRGRCRFIRQLHSFLMTPTMLPSFLLCSASATFTPASSI